MKFDSIYFLNFLFINCSFHCSIAKHTGGGPPEAKDEKSDSLERIFGDSAQSKGVPGGMSTSLFGGGPMKISSAKSPISSGTPRQFSGSSKNLLKRMRLEEEEVEIVNEGENPWAAGRSTSKTSSKALSMQELQRSVLEVELENATKWREILNRTPPILDKVKL